MISLRTLGTSEKKKSANTPATTPNDPAVVALYLEREPLAGTSYGKTSAGLRIHAFFEEARVNERDSVSA